MTYEQWREQCHRWAVQLGAFWLPCPVCGEHFSGLEHRDGRNGEPSSVYLGSTNTSQGICPKCTDAGLGHQWGATEIKRGRMEEGGMIHHAFDGCGDHR